MVVCLINTPFALSLPSNTLFWKLICTLNLPLLWFISVKWWSGRQAGPETSVWLVTCLFDNCWNVVQALFFSWKLPVFHLIISWIEMYLTLHPSWVCFVYLLHRLSLPLYVSWLVKTLFLLLVQILWELNILLMQLVLLLCNILLLRASLSDGYCHF